LRDINFEDFAIEVIEIRKETEEDTSYDVQLENARASDALDNWLLNILGPDIYRRFVEMADDMANAKLSEVDWALDVEYYDSSEQAEARVKGEDNYYEDQAYERAVELSRK
jgi:hypothetical protein